MTGRKSSLCLLLFLLCADKICCHVAINTNNNNNNNNSNNNNIAVNTVKARVHSSTRSQYTPGVHDSATSTTTQRTAGVHQYPAWRRYTSPATAARRYQYRTVPNFVHAGSQAGLSGWSQKMTRKIYRSHSENGESDMLLKRRMVVPSVLTARGRMRWRQPMRSPIRRSYIAPRSPWWKRWVSWMPQRATHRRNHQWQRQIRHTKMEPPSVTPEIYVDQELAASEPLTASLAPPSDTLEFTVTSQYKHSGVGRPGLVLSDSDSSQTLAQLPPEKSLRRSRVVSDDGILFDANVRLDDLSHVAKGRGFSLSESDVQSGGWVPMKLN